MSIYAPAAAAEPIRAVAPVIWSSGWGVCNVYSYTHTTTTAPQTTLSASTYQANILQALQQTGISNTSPGGKARAFCDIVGDQLGILDANKANDIAQALLPYAAGANLDLLGQIYGVIRLAATDASADAGDNSFQFYVQSGTFGAINNGQPIVIPSGTLIYTADPHGPVMRIAGDAVLNQGSFSMGEQYPPRASAPLRS